MESSNGHVRFVVPPSPTGRLSFFKPRSRKTSQPPNTIGEKEIEDVFADEIPGVEERDFKRRQVFHGWPLIWLAYQSSGVIYGDIGTSPLYVFSSTFSSEPSYDDLLGALSLIIWTLTLVVTVKYICIVLFADDEGEGGTFAIYNLLSRYINIAKRDPKTARTFKVERYHSSELTPSYRSIRGWLERSRIAHGILKALAVFAVSLIMADGILTPAQSILGAIQGLEVATPNISNGTIVGVSCAILIALFLLQPLGIHRIANVFAPIVLIWLIINMSFGIYNLVHHEAGVLKAFSPYFAGLWFVRNKAEGWKNLGGILLAFTGVEALFADLGAFSRRAIQLSWLCVAYPCLLLAYIGQAAYIADEPSAYSNPFFQTVPPGMFYPSLVIAVLAAIVASQALITSTFQLLSQVMHSSYFPQIKMIYTSDKFHGQVYIPLANWLLMVGTVIVTAVYNNTTRLGHAYGVCVILVTFITTNMVTLVALMVWRTNPAIVFAIWLPFVTLDGLYLTSALTKVPDGAWFTLLLAIILASIFTLWRYGKEKQWDSEGKNRYRLDYLVVKRDDGILCLNPRFDGGELSPIKGLGIFFDKAGDMVPSVYEHFLRKFEAHPEVVVLLHMRALAVPHVSQEERYSITGTSLRNCYRLMIRYGYNDHVVTEDLGHLVYQELRKAIIYAGLRAIPSPNTSAHDFLPSPPNTAPTETANDLNEGEPSSIEVSKRPPSPSLRAAIDAQIANRLAALDTAFRSQVVFMVGKEQLRILKANNFFKRVVLKTFLFIRENTRAKVASLKVPVENLVEVGFVKEI
ncbi:MAG: hypothetical protein M1820_000669 [Bogoriella megaspora]|nr:MAG: hypothetical protein M1820_000669 [Bogoriella megaspora]